jgi:proteasome alpha subunit
MLPYYVSPDQIMQDKAEYAKKGISKGRSSIILEYRDGILLVADNPSSSLNKISEIYDNIAFAGAGKYNEFENLRKAGIRHADLKGYAYSREDVTAKSLANAYSETLGNIFSQDIKPWEVEILVVEVFYAPRENEIYRISFDGSIVDERGFTAIGARADALRIYLKDKYQQNATLSEVLRLALKGFEDVFNQKMSVENLEVAVLDRNRQGRKFKRFNPKELTVLLGGSGK